MSSDKGRPPFYLGIDLGGTNIKSGVVDDTGRPISSVSIPTDAALGFDVGGRNLAKAGQVAVAQSGLDWAEIAGVGLGSPGTMDLDTGMLLDPPNLPGWVNVPIRQALSELLGKSVVLKNDANAAAYGEFWAGAGRQSRSLVLFTLGTGIGCGIVQEGRLIEGRHAHGAECGHIIIQMDDGRVCSCGARGHLEGYASATALVKRAEEDLEEERRRLSAGALDSKSQSVLHKALAEGTLTSQTIAEAASAGDALAGRLMRQTAQYLAVGAVSLMHTIDPDLVLFGGGMIAAGPEFLAEIRAGVRALAFPVLAAKTRIEYAGLGSDAGFIGAAGCARAALHENKRA